jgi:hypothetical protein
LKTSHSTIERGIDLIRANNADAAEALFCVSELCGALANAHDPVDQARILNALRSGLLEAQSAIASAVYASGQITLAKPGKVAA